jgi:hypothetical protein
MVGAARYQKRLRSHKGWPREQFVSQFAEEGVPRTVAEAAYDYYKAQSLDASFTLAPDDSLWSVFRHSPEDIDDDAAAIARNLDLTLPSEAILRQWPSPLYRVRDVVMWLNWVAQHQPPSAASAQSP